MSEGKKEEMKTEETSQETVNTTETPDEQTKEERMENVKKDILEDKDFQKIFNEEKDSEPETASTDNDPDAEKGQPKTDEQPKKPTDEEDDKVPSIPATLIEEAIRVGMSLTEAQAYKDPLQLATTVSALKDSLQSKSEEKEKEPEETAIDRLLQDEDMDEDLKDALRVINEQNKAMQQKLEGFEKQTLTQQQREMQKVQQARIAEFDTIVNGLGEDAKELFGEGTETTLDQTSTEFQNRAKLYDMVTAMNTTQINLGQKPEPLEKLVEIAGRSLFGDSFKSEKSEIKEKLKKQSQSFINKPGQRVQPVIETKDGKGEAIDAVAEYLKKIG